MKTFRRDKLRRLVEAGRIVMIGAYTFDDMYGADRVRKTLPVKMRPADWRERVDGVCYVFEHDFTSNSGCCYQNADGSIHLRVHSNSNYDFRILPE